MKIETIQLWTHHTVYLYPFPPERISQLNSLSPERLSLNGIASLHMHKSPSQILSAGDNKREIILTPRRLWHIYTKAIFDPFTRALLPNRIISVDKSTGLIVDVWEGVVSSIGHNRERAYAGEGVTHLEEEDEIEVVDLKHLTVLPGLVDVHVHLFLHAYSESPWYTQLTQESLAERTIRATVHARRTLLAGFTTVRGVPNALELLPKFHESLGTYRAQKFYLKISDLGTEGAEDADISLRKCLALGLIPGPRYYCANRAIVSTGGYGPKSAVHVNQEGTDGVYGAEVADGKDGCTKAVRRQIGAGADWIKIYADYRARTWMAYASVLAATKSIPLFNREELEAMTEAAHSGGVKIAAHTTSGAAVVRTLLELGIDSIEHAGDLEKGDDKQPPILEAFARSRTVWVPTLSVYYTLAETGGSDARGNWDRISKSFIRAVHEIGMDNIACGGDTGAFAHGRNALEMVLMRRLGAEWNTVLKWGTLGGWHCIRGMEWEGEEGRERLDQIEQGTILGGLERDTPFGAIRKGWVGDIVGVEGTIDGTPEEFESALMSRVMFVMKGGRIYKRDGIAMNDIPSY